MLYIWVWIHGCMTNTGLTLDSSKSVIKEVVTIYHDEHVSVQYFVQFLEYI